MNRLRRFLGALNRREIAARLLGAPEPSRDPDVGLVLVQIDGLSRRELERALTAGRMPFLKRLLARERYRLGTFYSGLPATTPAVQGELFHGVRAAVPTFAFRERETGEVVEMLDPEVGARRERSIAGRHAALLENWSAYCDIFRGGAAEAHFCVAALTWRSVLRRIRPWSWPSLSALYALTALRVLAQGATELVFALAEAVQGTFQGEKAKSEFEFIHRRVLVGTILREWIVAGARLDATRGLPIVHVNFLGYDEMGHRRGPDSAFAHRSLRGTDRAIRRIWEAAHRSRRRHYEVWVYSDHGQERTLPFDRLHGKGIDEAVREIAANVLPGSGTSHRITVVAIGPLGHIYLDPPLEESERDRLAAALAAEGKVPACYVVDGTGARFWTTSGVSGRLPEDAGLLFGADHPRTADVSEDLIALCRHPEAGQIVIGGWQRGTEAISFVGENGAHAGPGPHETGGFTLLPADVPLSSGESVRPSELREAALVRRAAEPGRWSAVCGDRPAGREAFRLVSYNVHGCVGTDGRLSTRRIARVLAQCDPDIILLQELDVGRARSGGRDQAQDIARELSMRCEFHAALTVAEEQYGNAVLCRWPMRLVQSGPLPQRVPRPAEPRGALWVEVETGRGPLQILTTHLGLSGLERLRQIEALLGPEWLGSSRWRGPGLFAGDLNSRPGSRLHRQLAARLRDAATEKRSFRTFPSRWPLFQIDHVFVTDEVEVLGVEAVRTRASVVASDHLPLGVEFRIGREERRNDASLARRVAAAPQA